MWNLCITPAFLAKCTDGRHHPEVHAALQYRVVELYNVGPAGKEKPTCPAGYDQLAWPDRPPAVDDLEAVLRVWLASRPKSPPRDRRQADRMAVQQLETRPRRPGRRLNGKTAFLQERR